MTKVQDVKKLECKELVRKFLTNKKGYEILEDHWKGNGHTFDFIIKDGEYVRFIDYGVGSGEFNFDYQNVIADRSIYEGAMVDFYESHPDVVCKVTFDHVALIINGERLAIRYYQNILRTDDAVVARLQDLCQELYAALPEEKKALFADRLQEL